MRPITLSLPASGYIPTTLEQEDLFQLLADPGIQRMLDERRAIPIEQRGNLTSTNCQLQRLRQASGSLGGARAIMMGSTSMFRNAPFLRWLVEESIFAGRDDLSIFGVGTGVMPLVVCPDIAHSHPWHRTAVKQKDGHFFTEPLELQILAARNGNVEYIDLLREARDAGKLFQRSGIMITAPLEGAYGVVARCNRPPVDIAEIARLGALQGLDPQMVMANFQPIPASIEAAGQIVARMRQYGVKARDVNGHGHHKPVYSELTFPKTFSERVSVRQQDLLLNNLPTDKDLVVACNVFPYIESDALKIFATTCLATVPKLGGLLALSGTSIPQSGSTMPLEISHGVLIALGYSFMKKIPLMYPGEVINVYQRPEGDDPFFQVVRQFFFRR